MTEVWKSEAAKRFNETIVMRPQEEPDYPGTPLPEKPPVTVLDFAEIVYEHNLEVLKLVVDTMTVRN